MHFRSIVQFVPRKFVPGGLVWTGVALVLIAAILTLMLNLSANHEQAQSMGEKDLGVAVLGVMFGLPILVFGGGGLLCIATGCFVFAYRRVRSGQRQ